MPQPRASQIDTSATPYYHCISRCVRRAFLCGEDKYSGINYEHRRQWLADRMTLLAKHFAIDVCAYAILHNHYHLVLRINSEAAKAMTNQQVVDNWTAIYTSGNESVNQYLQGKGGKSVKRSARKVIKRWRKRLCNISWFMRAMNEYIAKRANREDEVKGHFWEERFKSQALLDDTALLGCLAYVDLNPIRAGIVENLENSDFTSIQLRIKKLKESQTKNKIADAQNVEPQIKQPKRLLPFNTGKVKNGIDFPLKEYLKLVDWTGRYINPKKKGYIKEAEPALLDTIGIDEKEWFEMTRGFEHKFARFAGSAERLDDYHRSKQR